MKSSSPPSSSPPSSVTSTSVTEPPSSSSSPPPPLPHLSLRSPQLQAEFLERQNKFQFNSEFSESSVVSSAASPSSSTSPTSSRLPSPSSPIPSSPPWSPSSPCGDSRPVRLSLSSPELLSELKESRTRPLRHVPAHNGLTTVFSGRGRGQASGPAPSTQPANQKTSP
ncbi:uncharacterized protein [Thunnus thynnus]|uniref:uncharacterized protein n=1 Tax=Thunnus thynnus TaxID=8237 RepID=UPI003528B009